MTIERALGRGRRLLRGATDKQQELVEGWMATAGKYANHLTETGSRCDRNDGSTRFCLWEAIRLDADEDDVVPEVGVRCSLHPGGRYLDSDARLDPGDFA